MTEEEEEKIELNFKINPKSQFAILLASIFLCGFFCGYLIGQYDADGEWRNYYALREEQFNKTCLLLNLLNYNNTEHSPSKNLLKNPRVFG